MPYSTRLQGKKRKEIESNLEETIETLRRATTASLSSPRYSSVFILHVFWDYQGKDKNGTWNTTFRDNSRGLATIWRHDYGYDVTELELNGNTINKAEAFSEYVDIRNSKATWQLKKACTALLEKTKNIENPLIVFYYCGHGNEPKKKAVHAGQTTRDHLILQSGMFDDPEGQTQINESTKAEEVIQRNTSVEFFDATKVLHDLTGQNVVFLMDCCCAQRARFHNNQWLLAAAGPTNKAKDGDNGFTSRVRHHFLQALQTKEWLTTGSLHELLLQDFQSDLLTIMPVWNTLNPVERITSGTPMFHKLDDLGSPTSLTEQLAENVKINTQRKKRKTVIFKYMLHIDEDADALPQAAVDRLEKATIIMNDGDKENQFEISEVRLATVEEQKAIGSVLVTLAIDATVFFEMPYDFRIIPIGFFPAPDETGSVVMRPRRAIEDVSEAATEHAAEEDVVAVAAATAGGDSPTQGAAPVRKVTMIRRVSNSSVGRKISDSMRKISNPIRDVTMRFLGRQPTAGPSQERRVSTAPTSSDAPDALRLPKPRAGPAATKKENKPPQKDQWDDLE